MFVIFCNVTKPGHAPLMCSCLEDGISVVVVVQSPPSFKDPLSGTEGAKIKVLSD